VLEVLEKIKVLFESEDDAKLFRESLEEFCLNKRIGHIFKPESNLFFDPESGKKKFICEICEVEDDLVENIEALIEGFNGKRSY
jgi:hypothetical protein